MTVQQYGLFSMGVLRSSLLNLGRFWWTKVRSGFLKTIQKQRFTQKSSRGSSSKILFSISRSIWTRRKFSSTALAAEFTASTPSKSGTGRMMFSNTWYLFNRKTLVSIISFKIFTKNYKYIPWGSNFMRKIAWVTSAQSKNWLRANQRAHHSDFPLVGHALMIFFHTHR